MSAAASAAVAPAAATAAEPMDEGQKYDRMVQLWRFFMTKGACGICGLGCAVAMVEREGGNHTFRATRTGCAKGDADRCFGIAQAERAKAPPPPWLQPKGGV